MKKTVVTIIGARPQFIKAWPVSIAVEKNLINEVVIHTGQHYDKNMSEIFFDELGMSKPDYNLKVGGGSHGQMTGSMLTSIEQILLDDQPDGVLVYGDTNSTIAGALAASKLSIPVFHVEAGLRSFNKAMPEEQNRVVTDHLSSVLMCPTLAAVDNLRNENIVENVYHTGDVMYDATMLIKQFSDLNSIEVKELIGQQENYSLLTIHRAENTQSVAQVMSLIDWVNAECDGKTIIFPVHPRVKGMLGDNSHIPANIICIDPVGFIDMASLLGNCSHVFTDSGGVQKEAYFHGVRCTTLREQTEWIETVDSGWNRLYGNEYTRDPVPINEYGSGRAAEIVASYVSDFI